MTSERPAFIVRVAREGSPRRLRIVVPSESTWEKFVDLLKSRFGIAESEAIEIAEDKSGCGVVCLEDVLENDDLVVKLAAQQSATRAFDRTELAEWAAIKNAKLAGFFMAIQSPLSKGTRRVVARLADSPGEPRELLFVDANDVRLLDDADPLESIASAKRRGEIDADAARALLLVIAVPRHSNIVRYWTRFDVDDDDFAPDRTRALLKDSVLGESVRERGSGTVLVFDHHPLRLASFLKDACRPVQFSTVKRLLLDVCRVLLELERAGLILMHLDVDSIRVTSSGHIILTDFLDVLRSSDIQDSSRCHSWVIGLLAWQLMTGDSLSDEASNNIRERLLSLTYPNELISFVERCLSTNAADRPTLSDVVAFLEPSERLRTRVVAETETLSEERRENSTIEERENENEFLREEFPTEDTTTTTTTTTTTSMTREATEPPTETVVTSASAPAPPISVSLLTFPQERQSNSDEGTATATAAVTAVEAEQVEASATVEAAASTIADPPPSYAEACGVNRRQRRVHSPRRHQSLVAAAPADSSEEDPVDACTAMFDSLQLRRRYRQGRRGSATHHHHHHHHRGNASVADPRRHSMPAVEYLFSNEEAFCSIAAATPAEARQYLRLTNGNLEAAVGLYMDGNAGMTTTAAAAAAAAPPRRQTMLGRPRLRRVGEEAIGGAGDNRRATHSSRSSPVGIMPLNRRQMERSVSLSARPPPRPPPPRRASSPPPSLDRFHQRQVQFRRRERRSGNCKLS